MDERETGKTKNAINKHKKPHVNNIFLILFLTFVAKITYINLYKTKL